jgi:hypothetical protein
MHVVLEGEEEPLVLRDLRERILHVLVDLGVAFELVEKLDVRPARCNAAMRRKSARAPSFCEIRSSDSMSWSQRSSIEGATPSAGARIRRRAEIGERIRGETPELE